MQISRLEIFGFKSFLERLVLPLEPGITGVVGPNGCGKSNIVDALRWVLGETKARSLRGSSLEDVIFNGTDKLRPLGLAEVTLTLRSSDQNFFADLVSPTLEVESIVREAAEDGMIGDEIDADQEGDVEFEDQITTTSEETGARPQLTVVTGNLGATSQENSKAGLESGGLSSEERLANQATLLQRYSWLKSVSEVQVTRRLYRSGESEFFINRVACRLKDIKELFRAVGLGARTYTIVAQGEISRIISAKPEERRMILEEAAGILGFRDRISAAKRRLAETDVNLARLNDVTKEVSRQVNSLKRQAARARNRQELKNEIARLEHVLFEDRFSNISARLGEFDREHCSVQQVEGGLETRLHSEQSQEQALRSDLMSLDLKGDSLRMRVDSIKEELGNCARQRSMRAQRIGELQALASAAKNEISRLEERRATLEARIVGGSEQVVNLSSQAQSLELQLKDLDGNSRQRLLELADRLTVLKGKWRAQDSEGRRVRDELVSDRRALALIKEELLAVSPLKRFAEEFSAGGQSATEGDLLKNASLFMDGLVIPSELVKAVQAVIAE
ncbi:MAG: AAA family ATPase, partial [Deltaproteobacteria bacterium]|nr:AAA family ATPase [Deltaproteobacteria bacterium]